MSHVSFMAHESLAAVVAAEGKVSSMSSLVTNQFISVAKLLLAKVASVPLAVLMDSGVLG